MQPISLSVPIRIGIWKQPVPDETMQVVPLYSDFPYAVPFLYFRRIHNGNISLTHRDMSEKERYSILADAIREKWRKTK